MSPGDVGQQQSPISHNSQGTIHTEYILPGTPLYPCECKLLGGGYNGRSGETSEEATVTIQTRCDDDSDWGEGEVQLGQSLNRFAMCKKGHVSHQPG